MNYNCICGPDLFASSTSYLLKNKSSFRGWMEVITADSQKHSVYVEPGTTNGVLSTGALKNIKIERKQSPMQFGIWETVFDNPPGDNTCFVLECTPKPGTAYSDCKVTAYSDASKCK